MLLILFMLFGSIALKDDGYYIQKRTHRVHLIRYLPLY